MLTMSTLARLQWLYIDVYFYIAKNENIYLYNYDIVIAASKNSQI